MFLIKTSMPHRRGNKYIVVEGGVEFTVPFDKDGLASVDDEYKEHFKALCQKGIGYEMIEGTASAVTVTAKKNEEEVPVFIPEPEQSVVFNTDNDDDNEEEEDNNGSIEREDLEKLTVVQLHKFITDESAENPNFIMPEAEWKGLKKTELIDYIIEKMG